jgi:N-dimethylarginine dimethylaminohydrolase
MTEGATRYGAESMIAPLREVLVKRPGQVFGRAFEDPVHGFLHAVDLEEAQRQHDELCKILTGLGANVHELGIETDSPDLVYTFDPALVTDEGAVLLRPGKPTRQGEETALEKWFVERGIPVAGRIEAPEPRKAVTRSGSGRRSSASVGRSEPTRPGPSSWRDSSMPRCACSTCRMRMGRGSAFTS